MHLAAAEVKLVGAPVGVDFLLVELLAHEVGEAVCVGAEAAGHPVKDDADARLVAGVHEVLELLGGAEARRGRIVAGQLIAPAAVKRVLHDGQELDVAVAHLLDVVHQFHGELVVGEVGAGVVFGLGIAVAGKTVVVALPAAQMHLEDVERALHVRRLLALAHVLGVTPLVAADVGRLGSGARDELGAEPVRVGLVEQVALRSLDEVLVELSLLDALDEAFPDATGLGADERVGLRVPAVKIANDVDAPGLGRPDSKVIAALGATSCRVGTHLLVATVPNSLGHHEQVVIRQEEVAVASCHNGLSHHLSLMAQPTPSKRATPLQICTIVWRCIWIKRLASARGTQQPTKREFCRAPRACFG